MRQAPSLERPGEGVLFVPKSGTVDGLNVFEDFCRTMTMEQGRTELKALPPDGKGENSTPGVGSMRRWMRTVSEKLDLLTVKYGKSNNAILHKIYQDMEDAFMIVMDSARYRIMEEQGLEKRSVLAAIFFDEDLQDYLQRYVDYNLAPENRGW